jgi:hypothetical protein
MAVMEIFLPSGFTVDRDSLYALRRYKGVKRVDPEMDDTKVISGFGGHFRLTKSAVVFLPDGVIFLKIWENFMVLFSQTL